MSSARSCADPRLEQHVADLPVDRTEAMESDDGKVRKAQVEVQRGGRKKTFLRPIKELVLLVPSGSHADQSDTV